MPQAAIDLNFEYEISLELLSEIILLNKFDVPRRHSARNEQKLLWESQSIMYTAECKANFEVQLLFV